MKKWNKALASVLALVMAGSMLAGCGRETTGTPVDPNAGETEPVTTADPSTEPTEDEVYWFDEFDVMTLSGKEYGTDYESLYDWKGHHHR